MTTFDDPILPISDRPSSREVAAASNADSPRGRVLQVSFACDPVSSMESRLGWYRAVMASQQFDTTVICDAHNRPQVEAFIAEEAKPAGLDVRFISSVDTTARFYETPGINYGRYHRWHQRVFQVVSELHREQPFDLTHQIGLCGFREPGYLWKLDVPFVWGPVGGTQNLPKRYLAMLGPTAAVTEFTRRLINHTHIHYRQRVAAAARRAVKVFAANLTAQEDFKKAHGVDLELQLETGIAEVPDYQPRVRKPGEPLRILWAGRFRHWKGLPLLLRAVASIGDEIPLEIRLMGDEDSSVYRRSADRLGLTPRTTWLGWPNYREQLQQYQWADVFAFTSLRDTSGTGLLEALSRGCPIVGMNHQGAADIMDESCAVPISVKNPKQSIAEFRHALIDLFNDSDKLERLSAGAHRRAQDYCWERLTMRMNGLYQNIIDRKRADKIKSLVHSERSLDLVEPASSSNGRRS